MERGTVSNVKVVFLPAGSIVTPSSRYRVFQFLQPLMQQGVETSLLETPHGNPWKRLAYLLRLFSVALSNDVLFVQKRIFPKLILQFLNIFNTRIIYDFDDAIYLKPHVQPSLNQILKVSRVVIAGNDQLATYARKYNKRVVVIPTVVDTDLYQIPKEVRHPGNDRLIIGWIGSDVNHPDNVKILYPVLNWLGEHYREKVVLRVLASEPLKIKTKLTVEFIPWTLNGYLSELQKFDIGLMPLRDTSWNKGKCGFKLIQYMAVGSPVIASPMGINKQIVIDGETGYLAENSEEWQIKIARLINDEDLRIQMGQKARKHIEQHYSIKAVIPRMLETFRECGFQTSLKGSIIKKNP